MKLVEAYATNTGSKIDKPFIFQKFFPLPFDKYITIHASSGMASKNYDYYKEALLLILDNLTQNKYTIIQLGDAKDEQLPMAIDFRGKTDIHQTAYVLARSSLHLSNDTFSAHVAGHFKVPLVTLFSVSKPGVSAPFWNDPYKSVFIETDRKGKKPTCAADESPKTINNIKPEDIAEHISNLLGLNYKKNIETLYIGSQYKNMVIETVPNQVINPNFIKGVLNIRADYFFNEENIYRQIATNKCCIVVDRPLKIDILRQLRQNIALLIYDLDNDDSLDFVKGIRNTAIPFGLVTAKENDELDKLKLKYFNFAIVNPVKKIKKEEVDNYSKISDNTYFKTNRLILSDQKVFPSKAHWKANEPCESLQNTIAKIKDDQDFWRDIDNHFIFNKI